MSMMSHVLYPVTGEWMLNTTVVLHCRDQAYAHCSELLNAYFSFSFAMKTIKLYNYYIAV